MAVNEDLSAYSTTAASNTPAGGSNIGPDLDNHLRDIKRNVRRVAERYQGTTTPEAFRGREWIDTSATASTKLEVKLNDGSNEVVITEIDTSAGTSTPVVHGTAIPKGSMAVQAANAVNIDGGTIDGTPIGGTTPDAGDFTTVASNDNIQIDPATGAGYLSAFGYGIPPTLNGYRSEGTKASPTAIINNGTALQVAAYGYDGVSNKIAGSLSFKAAEAWSVGNNGMDAELVTTPNGSATPQISMHLKEDGTVDFLAGLMLQSGQTLLDQYDEGTFTPKIWDASLSDGEGQTYTTQLGYWTRIGNRYFISGEIEMSSLGTLATSQAVRLGGFPAISRLGARNGVAITVADGLSLSSAGVSVTGAIGNASDYALLRQWNVTTGTDFFTLAELTASGLIEFEGTFEV